jgi:5-methylcytosine-specific restriction endonuclease McrA
MTLRRCTKCKQEKDAGEFGRMSSTKDGIHCWCKRCACDQTKEYYRANREKVLATAKRRYQSDPERYRRIAREYREADPEKVREQRKRSFQKYPEKNCERVGRRRALELGAPVVEKIDRLYVIEREKSICHICGKKVAAGRDLTLDHLVPLSRGGNHTMDNLRVAHRSCNSAMHAGRMPAQLLLIA